RRDSKSKPDRSSDVCPSDPPRACQPLAEDAVGDLPIGIGDDEDPLAKARRRPDRVREAGAVGLGLLAAPHDEAIDDDLNGVLAHLVEHDVLGQVADGAVDADAREAAAPRGDEELLVLALPIADE